MKTKIKKTILSFAIIFSLFSCSKDDEPTPEPVKTYDIKGYYKGTIGTGTANTGYSFCLIMEENGLCTYIYNNKFNNSESGRLAYGTYTINGSQVSATINRPNIPETITFVGVYDNTTGKLDGSWTSTSSYNGKYILQKEISGKESLAGYWKGTYTLGTQVKDYYMIGDSDGTATIIDNATITNAPTSNIAYGNIISNGAAFTSVIKYNLGTGNTVNLSATFDNSNGKLINGSWTNTATNATGSWTLTKMYY
jgi:hypothetical protein